MSPTPRPRRAAAGVAVGATVLLAIAGTGLAASAVTSAVAAADARPARVAAAAPHAVQPTGGARVQAAAPAQVAPANTPAYTSPSGGTTTYCTMTPVPQYTAGQVVQSATFENGTPGYDWSATGTVGLSVDAAAAHQGNGGLQVVSAQNGVTTYRISNVRSTGTYQLGMWLRLSPDLAQSSSPYVMIYVQDEVTGGVLASLSPRLSTQWSAVSATVVAPTRQGPCGSGVWGGPMLVTFRVMAPACGTLPEVSLDVDDVSVTYVGSSSTVTPTVAPARVVPACEPPTTSTKPPTSTTPPTTSPAKAVCKVKATPVMTWKGGVQVQVSLSNLSGAALSGWTLTAKVPSGESAVYAWPGSISQASQVLTLTPASGYADPLAPRSPVKFGMVLSGGTALPSAWAVNGVTCKIG